MRAVLHVPSGEIIDFAKTNTIGKQHSRGLYTTIRSDYFGVKSMLREGSVKASDLIFRKAILDSDHEAILLHDMSIVTNCDLSEFEIIEIKETL